MARYFARCRACRRRRVLRHALAWYIRTPKCKYCDGILVRDAERHNRTQITCNSGCYGFPHRLGSRYCMFRKDWTRRLQGDQDYNDPNKDRYEEAIGASFSPSP